jgi:hypothetical protein
MPQPPANPGPTSAAETALLTHAVLVALTPLVPLPFMDDWVRGHLERRLVKALAREHGRELSDEDARVLMDEEGGLAAGLAEKAIKIPLKLLLRKVFYVLEVKRAADIASRAYHRGYLVDYALREDHLAPAGPRSAREIRAALDFACASAPIGPVEHAVRFVLESSLDALKSAAGELQRTMQRALRGSGPHVSAAREQVTGAVEAAAPREEEAVASVAERLRQALRTVPEEHFVRLRNAFRQALGHPPEAAPPGSRERAPR